MKLNLTKLLFLFLSFSMVDFSIYGQSRLVLNGAYINVNGGNATNSIYLVVENSNNNAISRNSGHIISGSEYNFVKWNVDTFSRAYVFPFGYGITDYLPFTYDKTDNAPVKLSFSTWGTNSDNNPHPDNVTHMSSVGDSLTSAIDRFWTMQATGPTQGYFTFSYRGAENTTTNPTTSTFSAQYWGAGDWSNQPPGGSLGVTTGVGNTTIPFSTTTGQYPFVLSRTGFPLPVDLISFNAQWRNSEKTMADLTWESASEINLSKYEVERSLDGKIFTKIGEVKAEGNSSSLLNYSYSDDDILMGSQTYYYRLKLLDYNHSFVYSNILLLTKTENGDVIVQVFPNPTEDNFNIKINGIKENTDVQILDAVGRVVQYKSMISTNGVINQNIDLSQFAKGVYFIKFPGKQHLQSIRVIKN